uniref:TNFR-Cys domain-containing protein n=1 Tax=Eutreptiella gymnastica TaxID=73025 RepID=A0A7S1NLU1_9EUGL
MPKKGKGPKGPVCTCPEPEEPWKDGIVLHGQACPKRGCKCGGEIVPKDNSVIHATKCTHQRSHCRHYPNLPMCLNCATVCEYCHGTLQFCSHCSDMRCLYVNKRDILSLHESSSKAKQPRAPPLIVAIQKIEMKKAALTLPPIDAASGTPRSSRGA